MKKFWTILCEGTTGGKCFRHDTFEKAKIECERLARLSPNQKFYILECMCACQCVSVVWTTTGKFNPLPF